MPITLPPFDQYQQPIVPLRGLWNSKPAEGDKFALITVDWMVTTTGRAVQFLLSANSPVAISQIVALSVDNRRSGYDVDFIFPDSGFILTVPAYNQLPAVPVFTNALMFYAVGAEGIVSGNSTTFMVLNSMPPPVSINPTSMQTIDVAQTIDMLTGATRQLVPAGINGTLNGFIISINSSFALGATVELIDGEGTIIWRDSTATPSGGGSQNIAISGLHVRFINGLQFFVRNSNAATQQAAANVTLFYTVP